MESRRALWDADGEFDIPDSSDASRAAAASARDDAADLSSSDVARANAPVTCTSGAKPLHHERWSPRRVVSALRWLRETPNTILASYARSYSSRSQHLADDDADGVIGAWDVEAGELQRALLHTAAITALVAPHPLSPALVVAGTEYGQLVMWDTRSRIPTPVLRAETGGAVPVRAVEAADASSPFVVSASADGSLAVWALANLAAPVETAVARERGLRDLRAAAMGIPASAAFQHTPGTSALGKRAAVLLGCEDGGVYRVDNAERLWTTHHAAARVDGPITALHCHPGHPRFPQLGDLAATACFDGSVALWSFGRRGAGLRVKSFDVGLAEPCCDVRWAPSHPGAFAVIDVAGGLSLYDVARPEGEMCLGRFTVPASGPAGALSCLSCLQWSPDGGTIATGSAGGGVHLWRASEGLTDPDGSSWEVVSASAKQWRAHATGLLGTVEELPVPASYPYTGLPPVFNPLSAT
jgi:dynein intermediate chain, cytosolic